MSKEQSILVNLSGRGDKDILTVAVSTESALHERNGHSNQQAPASVSRGKSHSLCEFRDSGGSRA